MQNEEPTHSIDGALEVVSGTALEAITRGEIDIQIKTAKQYPRSITQFKKSASEMALIDEETAESTLYRRPVGKKPDGTTEYAEGMSVRMAEIVTACYGNIRVGSMIVEFGERRVVARGFCHDLERNVASQSEVIEATVTKRGDPFSERMRVVIAKAALAKARRDATFQVIPKALCRPIESAVRLMLTGGENAPKTMEKRRTNVMRWLNSLNIDIKRVWTALAIGGEADLTADHIETLGGIRNALKDNDTNLEEAFPPIVTVKEGQVGANPVATASTAKPTAPPENKAPATAAAKPAPAPATPPAPKTPATTKQDAAPGAAEEPDEIPGVENPTPTEAPAKPADKPPGKKLTLSEARKALEGRLVAAQVSQEKLLTVLADREIIEDATIAFRSLNSDQLAGILDRWDELLPDLTAA